MEANHPSPELTQGEKAEAFRRAMADAMAGHNSFGGRKKKTTPGSTRTLEDEGNLCEPPFRPFEPHHLI